MNNIIFVLDASGSMASRQEAVISSFNNFLKEQRASNPDSLLTLVLFNDVIKVVFNNIILREVQALTKETYTPNGYTALLDAIGMAFSLSDKLKLVKVERTFIVILTDGLENSSKEYSRDKINSLIANTKNEVVFLGEGIAADEAINYGIPLRNTVSFGGTQEEVMRSFRVVSNSINTAIRSGQTLTLN